MRECFRKYIFEGVDYIFDTNYISSKVNYITYNGINYIRHVDGKKYIIIGSISKSEKYKSINDSIIKKICLRIIKENNIPYNKALMKNIFDNNVRDILLSLIVHSFITYEKFIDIYRFYLFYLDK